MLRKLVVLLVNLVLMVLAAAAVTVIWTEIIPAYRAVAKLRVQATVSDPVFQAEDSRTVHRYESFLNAQTATIKSATVLKRVLEEPEIQQTGWYREAPILLWQRLLKQPTTPPMGRLVRGLNVQPQPQHEVIDVSFMDPNAEDARAVLSAVINSYLDVSVSKYQQDKKESDKQRAEQLKALENEVAGREAAVSGLQKKLLTLDPQEKLARMSERLDATEICTGDIQLEIDLLKWKQRRIADLAEGANANDPMDTAEVLTTLLGDGIENCRQGLQVVQTQLAQLEYEKRLVDAEIQKQNAAFIEFMDNAQSLQKEQDAAQHHYELLKTLRQRQDQRSIAAEVAPVSLLVEASVSAKPQDLRVAYTAATVILCGLSMTIGSWLLRKRKNW